MSGSGFLCRRRPLRLSAEVAVEQERPASVAFLRAKAAEIRGMAGRRVSIDHVLGEEEAEQLARRIDGLADSLAAGLHDLDEADRGDAA